VIRSTFLFLKILSAIFLCFSVSTANTTELIVNGGFETGDLSGWTVDNQGTFGHWLVYSGTTLPLSSNIFYPPPQGTYAAAFDQSSPSSSVMYQDVILPQGETATLVFIYYYHNYAGIAIPTPDTLDPVSPPSNQQFRIDLMKPSADPFSVDPTDILQNFVQLSPGDASTLMPMTVSSDISTFSGQTVRLRFAAVDNEFYLNVGIDAVSIQTSGLPIPTIEPPPALTAQVIKNRFLTQADVVNHLVFLPSPSPNVVLYYIFKNGELIASVPANGPLVYNDPTLLGAEAIIYGVAALNAADQQSAQIFVTVP
jgi:hypothetical protein